MANSQLRISLTEITDPDSLAPVWSDLEARSEHSYFISWAWIGTWLQTLPAGIRPMLLKATEGERPAGLAVLVPQGIRRNGLVRSRRLHLHETGDPLLDELTIEFNGFLAEKGMEKAVAAACLEYLTAEVNDWDEIVLSGVDRIGNIDTLSLPGATLAIEQTKPVYFVDLKVLQETACDYMTAANKKTKYLLRRAFREYDAAGPLQTTVAADVAQAEEFFDGLRQLHQAHWNGLGMPGSFANRYFNEFHTRLISTRFKSGEIQLVRTTAGDQTVGYLYNIVHRGHVYHYQAGMNYPAWPSTASRPGYVCHYFAIEHNRLAGAEVYDLMAGESRYKRELATNNTQMCWAVLQRDRAQFRVERRLRRLVESFRSRSAIEADPVV